MSVNEGSELKTLDYFTKEGREILQKKLNEMAHMFFSSVAKNRGVSLEEVKENYGRGDSLLAGRALEAGMIDGVVMSYDEVKQNILGEIKMKEKEDVKEDVKEEAIKKERERACSILALTGDDEVKSECIEKGLSFSAARERIVKANQEKLKNTEPLAATREDDFHQPLSYETKAREWANDLIKESFKENK